MSKEVLCIILLVVFFAVMIYVGFYSRKHATDVNGFVLGGRGVGPWLTAFAFGTSYFSAVIFVGYAGQFGWNFGLASTWAGLGNAFIGLIKGTSLAFVCSVVEMTAEGKILAGRNYRYFEVYISLAIIYWVITFVLERVISYLEKKLRGPEDAPTLLDIRDTEVE